MAVKLGIVMDPIEQIAYKKDSSLAMLFAASKRGWQIHYLLQEDLYIRDGQARGHSKELQVFENQGGGWGKKTTKIL